MNKVRSKEELNTLHTELTRLAQQGLSQQQAADELGLGRPQVVGLSHRLGVRFKAYEERRALASKSKPETKPKPKPQVEAVAVRVPVPESFDSNKTSKDRRRGVKPLCMWAGCNKPTSVNKPFCREHTQ